MCGIDEHQLGEGGVDHERLREPRIGKVRPWLIPPALQGAKDYSNEQQWDPPRQVAGRMCVGAKGKSPTQHTVLEVSVLSCLSSRSRKSDISLLVLLLVLVSLALL
jgi:hypothetical protein